jgi:hypothetical protein
VKVVVVPLQIVFVPEIEGVGSAFTVKTLDAAAVQPFPSVAVTE